MPQEFESLTMDLDERPEDEFQHFPLNCTWTITSEDENLTVIITCLKWTSNYDLWIRVTAHPEGNRNISKQWDINKHNL